jgi:hypothetical protein
MQGMAEPRAAAHLCSASCSACSNSAGLLGTLRASRMARSDCRRTHKEAFRQSQRRPAAACSLSKQLPGGIEGACTPPHPHTSPTIDCRRVREKRGVVVARPSRDSMVAEMPEP